MTARLGARRQWPPDDSWSLADFVDELHMWRNLSALLPYALKRPQPPRVVVPQQRGPADERYEDALRRGRKLADIQQRRQHRARGHF